MTDFGVDSFDDISFYLGIEEGFCSSRSVCDSDISETDNEADDIDDDDSWPELGCEELCTTEETKERIIDLSNISHCPTLHVKNLTARNLVLRHDVSDTESETDCDEDNYDEPLAVRHYTHTGTSTELNLLEDLSLSSSPGEESLSSISGFELYIAFYSMALLTFLALKSLPLEARSCTSQYLTVLS
jgi:hypothetical protein